MVHPPYHFTDPARLAVFQARHEALALGAPELTPFHLALGVLKTLTGFQRAACFSGSGDFERLCAALGAGPEPAPLIPEDIAYSEEAKAVMAGAIRSAEDEAPGTAVSPFHILLGIHAPCDLENETPLPPTGAATLLAIAGLTPHQIRLHLDWPTRGE
jgi:hypothetical protein